MEVLSGSLTPEQKILCVGGSPRSRGNSDAVLDILSESFRTHAPAESEAVNLRDYLFHSCIGCERCRKDRRCTGQQDAMQLLYPRILESRGMILVSPTHHYNVTAWMKAFIDRMYCFYNFGSDVPRSWSSRLAGQGRTAAIIAICEQRDRQDMGFTLEAMRLPLEALGYEVVDELAVFKVFKRGRVREDDRAVDRVKQIATAMSASLGH